jgi:acyl-homoserine lactone acylase PvdQ
VRKLAVVGIVFLVLAGAIATTFGLLVLRPLPSVDVIPTGESGQPYSPHWGDQTQLWANGEYKPMALSRARIGPLDGKLVLRAR